MMRVTAVVEGDGDVVAIPTLVAKTGVFLQLQAVAPNPIRGGEWKKLRREGELERVLTLAASRESDLIIVVLDLDDGCVREERQSADARINEWLAGRSIRVEVVFLSREYETMFLHQPDCLGKFDANELPADPDAIRGAKERLKALTGKRYKETQDQVSFTQKLDLARLYPNSRAFRRFCKALSGSDYLALAVQA